MISRCLVFPQSCYLCLNIWVNALILINKTDAKSAAKCYLDIVSLCQSTTGNLHLPWDCVFWSRIRNLLLKLFPDYTLLALITLMLGKCLKGRKLPGIICNSCQQLQFYVITKAISLLGNLICKNRRINRNRKKGFKIRSISKNQAPFLTQVSLMLSNGNNYRNDCHKMVPAYEK